MQYNYVKKKIKTQKLKEKNNNNNKLLLQFKAKVNWK